MKVKSLRIPEEIDRAIDYVARSEKLEKTSSLRKLARMGFEVYVAKSYERGKLTLREATNLLNLTLIETIDLLSEYGIKGNIKARDVVCPLLRGRSIQDTSKYLWTISSRLYSAEFLTSISAIATPDPNNPLS